MLRLADKWVWDFWFAQQDGQRHVFYLQAPRALGDPSLRHHHATIGHAVPDGARGWEVLPDAVRPGPSGSWDDLATWTGSAIRHDGRWYMLYTGVSRKEHGLVQRIGLAISDDLLNWRKHPGNPVLEADPRWYEVVTDGRSPDQAWRDPWVFRCGRDGCFHVLVTARSRLGELDGAGVLGHARSVDLVSWDVLEPLTAPGEFAQLEVPQLVPTGRGYLILFSCHSHDHSRRRLERLGAPGLGGTFTLWSEDFRGPWSASGRPLGLAGDGVGPAPYAGKLISGHGGQWEFIASDADNDKDFLGELIGPFPAECGADGTVSVSVTHGVP